MEAIRSSSREVLRRVARDARTRRFIESTTVGHDIGRRYVAGESVTAVLDVTGELLARRRLVSVAHLTCDPVDREQARNCRKRLRKVLRRLDQAGFTAHTRTEISLRLCAVGAGLHPGGIDLALEHAAAICDAARAAGTRVTLETEHGLPVDVTLEALHRLRADYADTGIALQACLRRTEQDCADLARDGLRVRLSKGTQGGEGAYRESADVDLAFVRCLKILMPSPAVPVVATSDERLLSIAEVLASRVGRPSEALEYQLRYGVRPARQGITADRGDRMRVYLPFGPEWYPYLMSRVAEEPANLLPLLRAATAR